MTIHSKQMKKQVTGTQKAPKPSTRRSFFPSQSVSLNVIVTDILSICLILYFRHSLSLSDNKIKYAELLNSNSAQLHYLQIFFSEGFSLKMLLDTSLL